MCRQLLSLILLALVFSGCNDEDESPILLFITPSGQYATALPGELMKYQLEIRSSEDVSRLTITSQLDNTPTKTLLDSALSGKDVFVKFEFNAPQVADSGLMLLLFDATDVKNNRITKPITLIILNPGVLTESTGHTIYSHAGQKQDAFNLASKEALFSTESDSSLIDLLDVTSDSTNPGILSRRWKSVNGTRFVRFNDFNYANASYNYLLEVFEAGVKKSAIQDLQADDIILVRTPDNRHYAIRMVYVIDNEDIAEDRYIFNIKEAKNTDK
ncbi:MAG: hypothetical protein U0T82_13635 [Bacteroidales bacterium]